MDAERPVSIALAGGGLLLMATGLLHPRGAPVAQLDSPLWVPAHVLLLVSSLILWASLLVMVRTLAPSWDRFASMVGWATVTAFALAVFEGVPHLLAVLEADALAVGDPAPLYAIHSILEVFTNVLLGFSVAALSTVSVRGRTFGGGPAIVAIGILGGVAFGLATPLFLITGGAPAAAALFDGSILMGLWLLLSGVLLARRAPAAGSSRQTTAPAS